MENVQAQSQTQEAPQEVKLEQLPPEQLAAIRESLNKKLQDAYSALVQVAQSLPIVQTVKQQAFVFLDSGFLWLEKGISFIQLAAVPPTNQPPAPEVPPQETNQAA